MATESCATRQSRVGIRVRFGVRTTIIGALYLVVGLFIAVQSTFSQIEQSRTRRETSSMPIKEAATRATERAVEFDLDNDGTSDLIARRVLYLSASTKLCRIVVVSGATGAELLTLDSTEENDLFGYRATSLGDLDGDGVPDLAVGAPLARTAGTGRGRVDVLLSGQGWTGPSVLNPHGGLFALGLVPVDDQDGDGISDLVVGSAVPKEEEGEIGGVGHTRLEGHWSVVSSASGVILSEGPGAPTAFVGADLTVDEFWRSGEIPRPIPAPARTMLRGDLNLDQVVDGRDLEALTRFIREGGRGALAADITADGRLDEADLSLAVKIASEPRSRSRLGSMPFGDVAIPRGVSFGDQDCEDIKIPCGNCTEAFNCDPTGGGGGPPQPPPIDYGPDGDHDGDGIPNAEDSDFPWRDPQQPPVNPGGDDDNDGIPNVNDPSSGDFDPSHPNSDPDGDGQNNSADTDDDNDGIPDGQDEDAQLPRCMMEIAVNQTGGGHLPGNAKGIANYPNLPMSVSFRASFRRAPNTPVTYQWSASHGTANHPDEETVTLEIPDPGPVTVSCTITYTTFDGHPCTASKSYTFTVFAAKLHSVEFDGPEFYPVSRDTAPQSVYEAPHWLDSNGDGDAFDEGDRRFPICYVRRSVPRVARIEVDIDSGGGPMPARLGIKGIAGAARFEGELVHVGARWQGTGLIAQNSGAPDSERLADSVGFQGYTIYWSVWTSGPRGEYACTLIGSSNKLYRVAATPHQAPLYEALLSISTVAANGLAPGANGQIDEQTLVDRIWAPFAAKNVRRADGTQMGYYQGVLCMVDGPPCWTTAELLAAADGRCGAWANLFCAVLRSQGIGGLAIVGLTPDRGLLPLPCGPAGQTEIAPLFMLVKNFAFGTPGSLCGNYPYRLNHACDFGFNGPWQVVDAVDLAGVPAQLNANPPGIFEDHAIVRAGARYFDPSYGIGPFPGLAAYEQAAVDGFGTITDSAPQPPNDPNGRFRLGARANTQAIELSAIEQPPE